MKDKQSQDAFIHWFRQSSPYIQAHRNKTVVACLPGKAIQSAHFVNLLHDLALISSLGIRLVLVYGIRPQIESCLKKNGQPSNYYQGLRITDERALDCVKQTAGSVRLEIESLLSKALSNLPIPGVQTRTVSGNFISARPYGIHDGVDFLHTGIVRRVDTEGIFQQLNADAITLISPIGYSPTGEIFNLSADDVAEAVSIALSADKLILFGDKTGIYDSRRRIIRQLTQHEADQILQNRKKLSEDQRRLLKIAVRATEIGVRRVHILDWQRDGAVLQELFTRDGVGTLISSEPYDTIRPANVEDIPGILQIIEILEEAGVLVKRPRDLFEIEINRFLVTVRDQVIIGCAAIYPYEKEGMAELACLAMDSEYQGSGSGEQLLNAAQQQAKDMGINKLFVLTTQAVQWFRERGFRPAKIDELPMAKRRLYNYRRNAKVFIKTL